MPAPIFVYFCDLDGMTAIAGLAVAGCSIVARTAPITDDGSPVVCPLGSESSVVGEGIVGCMVVA